VDNQRFVDGIGAIAVVGGTVRVDFVTLSPLERDAKGQAKPVFEHRMIMSLDGFMVAAGKIQEAVEHLKKAGVKMPGNPAKELGLTINKPATETAPTNGGEKPASKKNVEKKPPFP
jgi:hypothetical protein